MNSLRNGKRASPSHRGEVLGLEWDCGSLDLDLRTPGCLSQNEGGRIRLGTITLTVKRSNTYSSMTRLYDFFSRGKLFLLPHAARFAFVVEVITLLVILAK